MFSKDFRGPFLLVCCFIYFVYGSCPRNHTVVLCQLCSVPLFIAWFDRNPHVCPFASCCRLFFLIRRGRSREKKQLVGAYAANKGQYKQLANIAQMRSLGMLVTRGKHGQLTWQTWPEVTWTQEYRQLAAAYTLVNHRVNLPRHFALHS